MSKHLLKIHIYIIKKFYSLVWTTKKGSVETPPFINDCLPYEKNTSFKIPQAMAAIIFYEGDVETSPWGSMILNRCK